MPDTITVTIPYPIEARILSDVLITAVEQGIYYWADSVRVYCGETGDQISIRNSDLFSRECSWRIGIAENCEGETGYHTKTREQLIEALTRMDPGHVSDIIQDNHDAETADVWIQTAIFGVPKYG